jgi:hypothetical protein
MKLFKYVVEIYVSAETAEDGLECMQEEFDYYFDLNNCLIAAVYLDGGELSEEN